MKKTILCLLLSVLLSSFPAAAENDTCDYDLLHPYEDGAARFVTDLKWGLLDEAGSELLSPTWDYLGELKENRRLVMQNLLYGFIDEQNKTVVAPIYTQAAGFSEGLAPVRNDEGEWGYIESDGTVAIPFMYDEANSFSCSLALVKKEGLYGYIDKENNAVIPCTYEEAYPFCESLACVAKDGLYGYIDTKGTVTVPFQFSLAFDFSEDAAVIKTETGYGLIDADGTYLIAPTQAYLSSHVENGFLIQEKSGALGLIDTNGNAITAFVYKEIGDFSEGLAPVRTEEGYGYINENGDMVITPAWDMAKPFSDGYAAVSKDGLFGYINAEGKLVTNLMFQDAGAFSCGLAPVQNADGRWFFVNPTEVTLPQAPEKILEESTLLLQIGQPVLKTHETEIPLEAAPVLENGVTMLPIRAVVEAIGGHVIWEAEEKKITLECGTHIVVLRLDEGGAFVDGRFTLLQAKPMIQNSRTLIPLRFVLEAFDCEVLWEPESQRIFIKYPEI